MADKPFRIFIEGQELEGWTEASLTRKKKDLTGELSVSIFFTYVPKTPMMRNAVRGKEITVYVGGHLAFTGTMDKRSGHGKHGDRGMKSAGKGVARSIGHGKHSAGGGLRTEIGKDHYTVTLHARGKTKKLIDSSHDHETGTMLNANTKNVTEKLVEPFQVELDWQAPVHELDKRRFRDGISVLHEIDRVANENAYYRWETRDGKLKVTDGSSPTFGEPLILGDNVLVFRAEQSEDEANSQIKVKGQRIKKNVRGKDAVIKREKVVKDNWVGNYSPMTLQMYGDASDEALQRRAQFEADDQASDSKKCEIEVFHVQARDGSPWDIGNLHLVVIPPEGLFDVMECTELTYAVSHDKTLKTKLTLAVPPGKSGIGAGAGGAAMGLGAIQPINDWEAIGIGLREQAGIQLIAGQYPDPWGPARLTNVLTDALGSVAGFVRAAVRAVLPAPPLTLPDHLKDDAA